MSLFTPFPYRINPSTMLLFYQLFFVLIDLRKYASLSTHLINYSLS